MDGTDPRPTARRRELIVEPVGDELLVYDTTTDEAHQLAPVAAAVFGACDGRATLDEVADAATRRLGQKVTPATARDALAILEERGLLDRPGLSRRDAVRRAALAGAGAVAAVPLVKSIVAPDAAAAVSLVACLPNGEHCQEHADCCSDNCPPAGFCTNNTGGGIR